MNKTKILLLLMALALIFLAACTQDYSSGAQAYAQSSQFAGQDCAV